MAGPLASLRAEQSTTNGVMTVTLLDNGVTTTTNFPNDSALRLSMFYQMLGDFIVKYPSQSFDREVIEQTSFVYQIDVNPLVQTVPVPTPQ